MKLPYTEEALLYAARYALDRSRDDRQTDSDRNRWADAGELLTLEAERLGAIEAAKLAASLRAMAKGGA